MNAKDMENLVLSACKNRKNPNLIDRNRSFHHAALMCTSSNNPLTTQKIKET
ncbi:hypothetical protein [Pseudomonas sp. GL-B-26]|uniref:hypothetical protein n=1 Tax=unclassified Pseudomonas TaxID=196821 RepID=UPI001CBE2D57|nr:hypothetical protein [Pseudomonas sp. GL-B-26]